MQAVVGDDRPVILADGGDGPSVLVAWGRSGGAPASAVGDVAEFLDVNVDQFVGPLTLVASDRHPGRAVQVRPAGGSGNGPGRRGRWTGAFPEG